MSVMLIVRLSPTAMGYFDWVMDLGADRMTGTAPTPAMALREAFDYAEMCAARQFIDVGQKVAS